MFIKALLLLTLGAAVCTAQFSSGQLWVLPSRSWNLRASAASGSCCEEYEAFCDEKSGSTCEALNECRAEAGGAQISCRTFEGNETRTKLFEYLCDSKDSCSDALDTYCQIGASQEDDNCYEYADCVIAAVEEDDGDGFDTSEFRQPNCGYLLGQPLFAYPTQAHACGGPTCLSEHKAACASPKDEDKCFAQAKCIDPEAEQDDFQFDEDDGCGACSQLEGLYTFSRTMPYRIIKPMCEAENEEELAKACLKWVENLAKEFPDDSSDEDGEDEDDDPEITEDDCEDFAEGVEPAQIRELLGCPCRRPINWVLIVGAAGAVFLLVCLGVTAMALKRGGARAVDADGGKSWPPPPQYGTTDPVSYVSNTSSTLGVPGGGGGGGYNSSSRGNRSRNGGGRSPNRSRGASGDGSFGRRSPNRSRNGSRNGGGRSPNRARGASGDGSFGRRSPNRSRNGGGSQGRRSPGGGSQGRRSPGGGSQGRRSPNRSPNRGRARSRSGSQGRGRNSPYR